MDSQDRDETKIRRQETLARRVGEALDQMKPRGEEECPDAEVLAAYAEQALGPDESTHWEDHFATCARCRNILRVISASADTLLAEKEVAQLGKLVSTVRAPVEITERSAGRARPRFGDWRTRWLAPALGVAAVLAVWFAMRPPWRGTDRGASETLVAQAPKEEVPPSQAQTETDRPSKVAPQEDLKSLTAPPSARLSDKTPSLNSSTGAPAESRAETGNEIKKTARSDNLAGSALLKEKKAENSPRDFEAPSPASPAPPPPPQQAKGAEETPPPAPLPQLRAQANAAASPAPEVPRSSSQTVTATETAPLIETTNGSLGGAIGQKDSANLPVNGRNFQALDQLRQVREFSALVKTASGSTIWRAGTGGIIERSTNDGKSWVSQVSPTRENWLAGAAVSDKICWLVGHNGAIVRTTDGQRWKRVAPPANAAGADGKLPDWTGVAARDAKSATITAGDGRQYATQNGGKTWQLQ